MEGTEGEDSKGRAFRWAIMPVPPVPPAPPTGTMELF